MGIVAITLGIVGLFAWIFPFLGFPISIVGFILGAIVILRKKPHRKLAVASLILCIVGIALNVIIVAVGIGALGMLQAFCEMFPECFNY